MARFAFVPSHSILALFTFLLGFALPVATAAEARVSEAYGRLPLHFEANRGQTHGEVRFLARGPGYGLYLTAGEAVLVLARPNPDAKRDSHSTPERLNTQTQARGTPAVLRMSLVDPAPKPIVSGLEELPGKANYFIGKDPAKWRTNVPTYAKVHYREVYPGIDLVYYGNQRQLEYDFVVAPGADPNKIVLGFKGADKLEIDAQGDLVLHAAGGSIRQRKTLIYQEIDGVRTEIEGSYALKGANRVGFQLAEYDRSRPLVIDPVLFYSTYLGGSGSDQGRGIAVDAAGAAYVTGHTFSADFTAGCTVPCTVLDANRGGSFDAFVTKLDPTGSMLLYSTYLGGSGTEDGVGIAVDTAGSAYVTGSTSSSDFPTTTGAFQTNFGGGPSDAFVAKLDPTGSMLVYSTYLGGSAATGGDGGEAGIGIAVDATGAAYVTGQTASDFIAGCTTPCTVLDGTLGGTDDGFVAKLDPTGSMLVYATYLGGSSGDAGVDIALDTFSNAYVTGVTRSTDFPTTTGGFDTTFNGGVTDAFVTKLDPAGSMLVYSTYLGGSGDEQGSGIAVDAAGAAYVTGQTFSADFTAGCTLPCTVLDSNLGGSVDAFATKLNTTGTALVYSTYLGGSGSDLGTGIAVDTAGAAYVTGLTRSADFTAGCTLPCTVLDATLNGVTDAFVTKLDPTGSMLVYATYLGGSGDEVGSGIAVDALPSPNAYVTGATASADFPTTTGAFDTTFNGVTDAFVAKIVAEPSVLTVAIDIKPGSDPNSINLGSAGVVPVAILSSATFDATQINPETVTLAGAEVRLIGRGSKYACGKEDTNGDGLLDLVCHVETAQFMIEPGSASAVLTGTTFGGQDIRGEDSIQIVQ